MLTVTGRVADRLPAHTHHDSCHTLKAEFAAADGVAKMWGWIARHWRAVVGYASVVLNVIRFGFEFAGDVDLYLAHRSGQPVTWLGHLLDFLIAPPSWAIMATIVAGL